MPVPDRSKATSDLISWYWLFATLGTVVLSVFGLLITMIISVVLFRRRERLHAIAGFVVSLAIAATGIWIYNAYILSGISP